MANTDDDAEKVGQQIASLFTGDLAAFAEALQCRVREVCGKGGEGDLLGPNERIGSLWWQLAVAFLVQKHKWFLPAESLLKALWDDGGERQRIERVPVNRAMFSQELTQQLHARGDQRGAFRWALHTQAEDILKKGSDRGQYGRQWLYGAFGVSDEEIRHLSESARRCREDVDGLADGWASPSGFSEEAIRRLAYEEAVGAGLFARTVSENDFTSLAHIFARLPSASMWKKMLTAATQ